MGLFGGKVPAEKQLNLDAGAKAEFLARHHKDALEHLAEGFLALPLSDVRTAGSNDAAAVVDIMSLPEMCSCPLLAQVAARGSAAKGYSEEKLSFSDFVELVNVWSVAIASTPERRWMVARCNDLFDAFDLDGDGTMSSEELFHIMRVIRFVGRMLCPPAARRCCCSA